MVAEGYKKTEIGIIPEGWEVVELATVTTILLSNVDKKSKEDEQNVKLCNYMDVYNNEYITNDLVYMEATAKDNQIEKFHLQINDVIITKDSETKDDIAIPAVVKETFENLICGYHLAILRPKENILYGVYLMKAIQSMNVHKHFEKLANGITRFGLTSSAINQALIPLPPLKEQKKIANILSTTDEKIDAISSQIQKAQNLKKGLLQKLLSEGIGHSEFKDSKLGKIPKSWEVDKLENLTTKIGDGLHGTPKYVEQSDYYFINGNNLNGKSIEITENTKYVSEEEYTKNKKILDGTTLLLSINGTIGNVAYYSSETVMLGKSVAYMNTNNRILKQFLFYLLKSSRILNYFTLELTGSTIKNLSLKTIRSTKIPLPPLEEQKQIAQILSTADEKLEVLKAKKEKYETLKKGLLQKLLSGEIRV